MTGAEFAMLKRAIESLKEKYTEAYSVYGWLVKDDLDGLLELMETCIPAPVRTSRRS